MLRIAKVLKSDGTEGGLLVSAPEFDLQDLQGPVFIEFDGLPVPFFVSDVTPHGSTKYVIHLTDVEDLKDAEEMVGRFIYADVEDEESESGIEDFTGWTLLNRGREVGVITSFEDIPGNPCIEIAGALVPIHEDLVISIDADNRKLDLDIPEGLL